MASANHADRAMVLAHEGEHLRFERQHPLHRHWRAVVGRYRRANRYADVICVHQKGSRDCWLALRPEGPPALCSTAKAAMREAVVATRAAIPKAADRLLAEAGRRAQTFASALEPAPRRRRPVASADLEAMFLLREVGCSSTEVARALGVSDMSVLRWESLGYETAIKTVPGAIIGGVAASAQQADSGPSRQEGEAEVAAKELVCQGKTCRFIRVGERLYRHRMDNEAGVTAEVFAVPEGQGRTGWMGAVRADLGEDCQGFARFEDAAIWALETAGVRRAEARALAPAQCVMAATAGLGGNLGSAKAPLHPREIKAALLLRESGVTPREAGAILGRPTRTLSMLYARGDELYRQAEHKLAAELAAIAKVAQRRAAKPAQRPQVRAPMPKPSQEQVRTLAAHDLGWRYSTASELRLRDRMSPKDWQRAERASRSVLGPLLT